MMMTQDYLMNFLFRGKQLRVIGTSRLSFVRTLLKYMRRKIEHIETKSNLTLPLEKEEMFLIIFQEE